ncbi:MAG: hypothetical protein IIC55_03375 [Proteobacteria bacterium]|nr:hypothetical protein [Pseudomonadota bacterium]
MPEGASADCSHYLGAACRRFEEIGIAGAEKGSESDRSSEDSDRQLELFGLVSAGVKRELEQVDVAFDGIENFGRSDIVFGLPPGTECQ